HQVVRHLHRPRRPCRRPRLRPPRPTLATAAAPISRTALRRRPARLRRATRPAPATWPGPPARLYQRTSVDRAARLNRSAAPGRPAASARRLTRTGPADQAARRRTPHPMAHRTPALPTRRRPVRSPAPGREVPARAAAGAPDPGTAADVLGTRLSQTRRALRSGPHSSL